VIDIFAAPGGFSLGFREAGYRVLAVVDKDPWGCRTLEHNFSADGTLVVRSDLRHLDLKARVDVVIGGPPCQGFSTVGRPKINHLRRTKKRKRFIDYARNRLYKEFIRVVKSLSPQFFVMENVPGIIQYNNGRIRDQILQDFKKAGYRTSFDVLNAADFGVPQTRKRAIFIGNRMGVENPFPLKTHYDPLKPQASLDSIVEGLRPHRNVFEAISDLPRLEPGGGSDTSEYAPDSGLTEYQKWTRTNSTKLSNHVARRHSDRDRDLFRLLEPGQRMKDLPEHLRPYRSDIFADKIKKQRWDRPSNAIVAHMEKDGLMYVHPDRDQARTLTPREAARLQSFPDTYAFIGPLTKQYKQIGNAVPPLMAKAIALRLKPLLSADRTRSTTPYGEVVPTIH
jgi:DNA (cytosine-5)-methyltransferase 1